MSVENFVFDCVSVRPTPAPSHRAQVERQLFVLLKIQEPEPLPAGLEEACGSQGQVVSRLAIGIGLARQQRIGFELRQPSPAAITYRRVQRQLCLLIGLCEVEPGGDRSVEPLPQRAAEGRQPHDVVERHSLFVSGVDDVDGAGHGSDERADDPLSALKLELVARRARDELDVVPLDGDRAHAVGLDRQLAAIELLDLASDAIAVLELDDVGLDRRRGGSGGGDQTPEKERG